ncbi:hypothetical protein DPMN_034581 [Dreissena polymorpha]|uniref:Uncharacterized protein n=1 Tax=Dreissena polymorpha TaxID=45954 RepID=A0A9D4RJW3_DREPO|nr:hypothetical protein DPMN_034581 [Dreissena polymorpha]
MLLDLIANSRVRRRGRFGRFGIRCYRHCCRLLGGLVEGILCRSSAQCWRVCISSVSWCKRKGKAGYTAPAICEYLCG